jgi:hypothetical protein
MPAANWKQEKFDQIHADKKINRSGSAFYARNMKLLLSEGGAYGKY